MDKGPAAEESTKGEATEGEMHTSISKHKHKHKHKHQHQQASKQASKQAREGRSGGAVEWLLTCERRCIVTPKPEVSLSDRCRILSCSHVAGHCRVSSLS